jgi:Protein of unknown function (DUF3016)
MKVVQVLILVLFATVSSPRISGGAQPGDVTIQYVQPQKFTDFKIYGRDYQWSASYFAGQISGDLKPLLKRRFPGSNLTLRFTDIDLAGSTGPRSGHNVRVVRGDIVPARMSFDFLLQDSNGRKLANGSTRLIDSSRSSSFAHPKSSEPLYYEKRMLEKWLKSLRPAPAPTGT